MISLSLTPRISVLIGSWGRTPSRNRISCVSVKTRGWPASDGMPCVVEFPPSPWQPSQVFRRSATCAVAPAQQARAAAATIARGTHQRLMRFAAAARKALLGLGLASVAHAVDGAHLLIRHEQRTVRHLQNIGRAAPELVLLRIQEARHERRHLGIPAVGAGPYVDHVVAELLGAV